MSDGTSEYVRENPGLFLAMIESVVRLTGDGLLVGRKSRHNANRYESYPSDKIRTTDDFETRIGRRLAGATVGYPADAGGDDDHLWLRFIDGAGNRYYVEFRDAPTPELRKGVKDLYALAARTCDQGKLTPPPPHG